VCEEGGSAGTEKEKQTTKGTTVTARVHRSVKHHRFIPAWTVPATDTDEVVVDPEHAVLHAHAVRGGDDARVGVEHGEQVTDIGCHPGEADVLGHARRGAVPSPRGLGRTPISAIRRRNGSCL
jgi:hypothetical protein